MTESCTNTPEAASPKEAMISPPTSVPCPDWCTRAAGHGYDLESSDGSEQRSHLRTFGDDTTDDAGFVDLRLEGTWSWRDENEMHGAPHLSVWIGGNSHESYIRDPEQARSLAAALTDAADALEAVRA